MPNSNTSGENIASRIDFRPVPSGQPQYLSAKARAEIIRDLIVAFENVVEGDVIFSPTAPDDKTKAWWQTDPVTGIPIGQPKHWSEADNEWVDIADPGTSSYTPPVERTVSKEIAVGASQVTFEFAEMGTDEYHVSIVELLKIGGDWLTPPANMNNYARAISGKSTTSVVINFFGVPAGGLTCTLWLRAPETTATSS